MRYVLTALPMEAGIASASGREFRKTNFPIWVIPWAVVDVPMRGTPLALASGPTTFISVLSVGPRIATTWSELMSFAAEASACACFPEESSMTRSIRTPPRALISSCARRKPWVIASPYAAPGPVRIEITPIFARSARPVSYPAFPFAPRKTRANATAKTKPAKRTFPFMENLPKWFALVQGGGPNPHGLKSPRISSRSGRGYQGRDAKGNGAKDTGETETRLPLKEAIAHSSGIVAMQENILDSFFCFVFLFINPFQFVKPHGPIPRDEWKKGGDERKSPNRTECLQSGKWHEINWIGGVPWAMTRKRNISGRGST